MKATERDQLAAHLLGLAAATDAENRYSPPVPSPGPDSPDYGHTIAVTNYLDGYASALRYAALAADVRQIAPPTLAPGSAWAGHRSMFNRRGRP